MELIELLNQAKAKGQDYALVTLIAHGGSSPRHEGAKMIVFADGSILGTVGGGPLEAEVILSAQEAVTQGRARKIKLETGKLGMYCGGWAEFFIDVAPRAAELLLLGGGHVAGALARVAEAIRFPYRVVDDRAEWATAERFPGARERVCAPYRAALGQIEVTPETYICILTRCHAFDFTALAVSLATKARYIGLIGSDIKTMKIFRRLERLGYKPREDARVHAPIGLVVGDHTPEEIAISIMAEVLLVKSGGTAEQRRDLFRRTLHQVVPA